MTKTIRKLEKESNTWKTRYENTNVSLVQMVEEVYDIFDISNMINVALVLNLVGESYALRPEGVSLSCWFL